MAIGLLERRRHAGGAKPVAANWRGAKPVAAAGGAKPPNWFTGASC